LSHGLISIQQLYSSCIGCIAIQLYSSYTVYILYSIPLTRAGIKVWAPAVDATQSVQRQDAELREKDVFEGRWVVLEDAGHDRWHGGHGGHVVRG
jgi:hypothetical protein